MRVRSVECSDRGHEFGQPIEVGLNLQGADYQQIKSALDGGLRLFVVKGSAIQMRVSDNQLNGLIASGDAPGFFSGVDILLDLRDTCAALRRLVAAAHALGLSLESKDAGAMIDASTAFHSALAAAKAIDSPAPKG